jgi:hypothetical protein
MVCRRSTTPMTLCSGASRFSRDAETFIVVISSRELRL